MLSPVHPSTQGKCADPEGLRWDFRVPITLTTPGEENRGLSGMLVSEGMAMLLKFRVIVQVRVVFQDCLEPDEREPRTAVRF